MLEVFARTQGVRHCVAARKQRQAVRDRERGRAHHAAARRLPPLLSNAIKLMGFALIVALLVAFLLSNLALRPMTEISRQLD